MTYCFDGDDEDSTACRCSRQTLLTQRQQNFRIEESGKSLGERMDTRIHRSRHRTRYSAHPCRTSIAVRSPLTSNDSMDGVNVSTYYSKPDEATTLLSEPLSTNQLLPSSPSYGIYYWLQFCLHCSTLSNIALELDVHRGGMIGRTQRGCYHGPGSVYTFHECICTKISHERVLPHIQVCAS